MTSLSWPPPPVTKCGECPHERTDGIIFYCKKEPGIMLAIKVIDENKNGITPSCPKWREQNKEN